MKKFLVITGLALSLVGANAFAQAKKTAAEAAVKVTRGAEVSGTAVRAGTKGAKQVKLQAPVKATAVSGASASSANKAAPKAKLDVSARGQATPAAAAPASQLNQSARQKPAQTPVAKQDGAVCIGGKNFSSSCGSFTTNESISLVRQMIDTETTPAEISATLAKAQGISTSEAQGKVAKLMQAGCIIKN